MKSNGPHPQDPEAGQRLLAYLQDKDIDSAVGLMASSEAAMRQAARLSIGLISGGEMGGMPLFRYEISIIAIDAIERSLKSKTDLTALFLEYVRLGSHHDQEVGINSISEMMRYETRCEAFPALINAAASMLGSKDLSLRTVAMDLLKRIADCDGDLTLVMPQLAGCLSVNEHPEISWRAISVMTATAQTSDLSSARNALSEALRVRRSFAPASFASFRFDNYISGITGTLMCAISNPKNAPLAVELISDALMDPRDDVKVLAARIAYRSATIPYIDLGPMKPLSEPIARDISSPGKLGIYCSSALLRIYPRHERSAFALSKLITDFGSAETQERTEIAYTLLFAAREGLDISPAIPLLIKELENGEASQMPCSSALCLAIASGSSVPIQPIHSALRGYVAKIENLSDPDAEEGAKQRAVGILRSITEAMRAVKSSFMGAEDGKMLEGSPKPPKGRREGGMYRIQSHADQAPLGPRKTLMGKGVI